MLKKQIFSLMFSTAIFTTSPLFAMNHDNEDKGRGTLCIIGDAGLKSVIDNFSDAEVVEETSRLSCTSKGMRAFLDQPYIWNSLAIRVCPSFDPQLPGKPQVKFLFSLWNDPFKVYKVLTSFLHSLKKAPYEPTDNQYFIASCEFSVGMKRIKLECSALEDNLDLLDPRTYLTFTGIISVDKRTVTGQRQFETMCPLVPSDHQYNTVFDLTKQEYREYLFSILKITVLSSDPDRTYKEVIF